MKTPVMAMARIDLHEYDEGYYLYAVPLGDSDSVIGYFPRLENYFLYMLYEKRIPLGYRNKFSDETGYPLIAESLIEPFSLLSSAENCVRRGLSYIRDNFTL